MSLFANITDFMGALEFLMNFSTVSLFTFFITNRCNSHEDVT